MRLSPDVIARRLGDGTVLVHLPSNRIFQLNESGARAWELIGQGLSLQLVVDRLVAEFDASIEQIEREVNALVAELGEAGLLES